MNRQAITRAAVVTVAVIAAVVSYAHMHDLAAAAGENWRSFLIPISVDGLIVAASMVLLVARAHVLAWLSLSVAVLASLAANMAAARPEPIAVLIAGWSPIAFAAAFHLLLAHRRITSEAQSTEPAASPALSVPVQATAPVTTPEPAPSLPIALPAPAPRLAAVPALSASPQPARTESTQRVSVDDVAKLAHLERAVIAQRLGVSVATVDRRLKVIRAAQAVGS